jgi:rhodanese-related sulfurtransferase
MNVPVPGIGVEALGAELRSGSLLVDVREPAEYIEAHVGGAWLVPLQTVPQVVAELPNDSPVYIICHAGGRSHQAAVYLRQQGIDAVNVLGGTAAWLNAGLPFEQGTDAGPPPTEPQ